MRDSDHKVSPDSWLASRASEIGTSSFPHPDGRQIARSLRLHSKQRIGSASLRMGLCPFNGLSLLNKNQSQTERHGVPECPGLKASSLVISSPFRTQSAVSLTPITATSKRAETLKGEDFSKSLMNKAAANRIRITPCDDDPHGNVGASRSVIAEARRLVAIAENRNTRAPTKPLLRGRNHLPEDA